VVCFIALPVIAPAAALSGLSVFGSRPMQRQDINDSRATSIPEQAAQICAAILSCLVPPSSRIIDFRLATENS
jgi:hypothetical protein